MINEIFEGSENKKIREENFFQNATGNNAKL
jgi:hypothetical protein